jgi:hypothetical protein
MRLQARVTFAMRDLDRLKVIQAVIDGDLQTVRAAERLGLEDDCVCSRKAGQNPLKRPESGPKPDISTGQSPQTSVLGADRHLEMSGFSNVKMSCPGSFGAGRHGNPPSAIIRPDSNRRDKDNREPRSPGPAVRRRSVEAHARPRG